MSETAFPNAGVSAAEHTSFFANAGAKLHAMIASAGHAAALVYHSALVVEKNVSLWEHDHPELKPLIDTAVAYSTDLLTRSGIPAGTVLMIGRDIVVAMKALAAADATVAGAPVTSAPLPAPQAPPPAPT